MEPGSGKRLMYLALGIVISYLVAEVVSDAVLIVFRLGGAVGMIVSMVVFAGVFFAVIGALQKYAGILFFGGYGE